MNKRPQILIIIALVAFALLFLRLLQLQIAEYNKYNRLAADNAAKNVPDPAPRGIIYDRSGRVLVENRPIFSVRIFPYILSAKGKQEQDRILKLLGQLLGEKIELKTTAGEPLIIKDNISLETAIRIEEKERDLDGVVVSSRPVRLTASGSVASHLLGFVGEIEADELEKLRDKGYRLGDFIGKDGVEKNYDELIRGIDGGQKVEVDVHGTPVRIIESLDPVSGSDAKLTIDLELQKAAEKALSGKEGAVVVLSAKTGEILALASYPNYDPNIFTDPKVNWKWQELKSRNHPFINRALAIYPPGSIFKVVTLAAALEEGKTTPDEVFNCPGYYRVNNRVAKCWLGSGHGRITPIEALTWSCDVVFFELGRRLGPDLLAKYAEKIGLGSRSDIDLPQEKKGTIPTKAWKEQYLKEPWYEGDSINYGIGQGFVQVTPLQMALVYAGVATGKIYKPYVVAEIKDRNGEVLYKGESKVVSNVSVSSKTLELMRQALREVVRRATGVAANVKGFPTAGKTGTAENPGRAHAWFLCYAPFDDPEIVIAAFVAHGEHGDRASAYVARDILNWYKENRLKKVYPEEKHEGQYILHGSVKVPYGRRSEPKPELPGNVPEQTD
ncbi:MAG: penicillin-binding protein 2 [Candidatus Margulisbacteria bacterium]|nr:penicillin-binding protein 2 [Candidatus Margulisiibacteriota bacterium]